MPCVRVWDMEDQSHPQISEMAKGHKFGIACVVCNKKYYIGTELFIRKVLKLFCSLKGQNWMTSVHVYWLPRPGH